MESIKLTKQQKLDYVELFNKSLDLYKNGKALPLRLDGDNGSVTQDTYKCMNQEKGDIRIYDIVFCSSWRLHNLHTDKDRLQRLKYFIDCNFKTNFECIRHKRAFMELCRQCKLEHIDKLPRRAAYYTKGEKHHKIK